MAASVGIRELKTHLGRYLRLVRSGKSFVVTDRGRPVAEIRPVPKEADDESAILREMAARGEVTLGDDEPLSDLDPVRIAGGSLADEIVALRREDRV
jgi:prevent-host-death family protein